MIDRAKTISKLELIRCNSEWNEDFNKALDRAIKILRQTDSEDCVSRQAVLDLLAYWVYECEYDEVAELVKKLPPVTPTKRTGEWIKNENGTYSCSECHSWLPEEQRHYARYCLYCGAKMKGGDTE